MVWLSPSEDKHAHMVLSLMRKGTHGTVCRCSSNGSDYLRANGTRFNQMLLSAIFLSKAVAVSLWGVIILFLAGGLTHSEAIYISPRTTKSFLALAVPVSVHNPTVLPALSREAFSVTRISASDLLQRQELERSIQLAAFQQFDSHRTGRVYNVSVSGVAAGDVRAVRLRSGSFKRYGVDINEFTIPEGCIVSPIPERIILVYSKLSNISLFQSLPAGYVLASPVLSVFVYDAGNLNSSQTPSQISVLTTGLPISIKFTQSSAFKCAYFSDNTTAVDIFDLVQGTCQVDHLGSFAAVRNSTAPAPAPAGQLASSVSPRKHSNAWKIVVGSVVGGFGLLALISLLALGFGKRRKDAKLSRMEYQTEHGETLQMATIRNSRVPTATNTRTQATLVNDYAV